jgi:hypothetical protein
VGKTGNRLFRQLTACCATLTDAQNAARPATDEKGVMSETWKDAQKQSTHRIVLDVAASNDGTYEIIFNEKVVGSRIPERWLDDELCAKRGFCYEELASIKRQLNECVRAVVVL